MGDNLETRPQYPANGAFKISGEPAQVVRERGDVGGPATRNPPSDVGHQAPGGGPKAIGVRLANKYVCKVGHTGGQRQVNRIYYDNQCCSTVTCKVSRCKTCKFIDNRKTFVSPITGTYFSSSDNANCTSRNVVYLLSCKKCNVQYVGETTQCLRERFGQHRNSVVKNQRKSLLVRHFNSADHCVSDMQIRVLQIVSNCEKQLVKGKLLEAEDFWIRQLVSAYPFGLNDKIKGYGMAEDILDPTMYKRAPFFQMPTPKRRRGHGRKPRRVNRRLNENFTTELEQLLCDSNKPTGIRSLIIYLRKQSQATLVKFNKIIRNNSRKMPVTVRVIVLAFFSGYFAQRQEQINKSKDCYRLCVDFPNKGMEIIGFQNIFKDSKFCKIIPSEKREQVKPVAVVYKYLPPFSRTICNYSACLREISNGNFNDCINKCSCANYSEFVYEPTGHVITGNLDIIPEGPLRNIFSKGAKYRLPKSIDWTEVENASFKAIVSYTQYLLRKKIITVEQWKAMQDRFMQIVLARIATRTNECFHVDSVNELYLQSELCKVHSNFVITPADKAANNYVIVCKLLYLKILCQEMGVISEQGSLKATGNETYAFVNTEEVAKIIPRHQCVAKRYGLIVSKTDCKLPQMFSVPKLHKSPYGWRFIAGARKSSTKAISIRLHNILGSFKRHFMNYCKVIETRAGYNCFWSVNSSIRVKDRLSVFSTGKSLEGFISADFGKMFAQLPHKVIERCLFSITDKCFNNSGKTFLCVEGTKVFFVDDCEKQSGDCFRREEIKDLICDVIGETYVQFAGLTFRQVCGVPMGNNASPMIADLTMVYLEYDYLTKHNANIWGQRYIDDILVANCNNFMQIASTIYPPDLPLKRTNELHEKVDFLDLSISIKDGSPVTSVYDKTDDFPFRVVKYGFADSNVHSRVGLCTFYSQLVRFARLSDESSDFEGRVLDMFLEFIKHNYQRESLICKFFQFVNKYRALLYKFDLCSKADVCTFVQKVFSR